MAELWRREAACRGQGFDPVFFDPTGETAAKAVCAGCRVRLDCLWWAIDEGLRCGVFGGATEEERDLVARRLRRRPSAMMAGR